MKTTIAILIFTQEASKEATRKTLTPNKNWGLNQYLFSKLNNHIISVAKSTKLPVFLSKDLIESKGLFGKQLTEAVQKVFEKGFEKVICLGNDCPALSIDKILNAATLLEKHNSIIGPDTRGGTYLIGLSKANFKANVFENLAWESNFMLNSFTENFDNQPFIIEQLADIHTYNDLKKYTQFTSFAVFLLRLIEATLTKTIVFVKYFFDFLLSNTSLLRAPPVY